MPQISDLIIRNYRGIANLELHDLPARVLLTGPNGAGKSTVFSAIHQCLFRRTIDRQLKRIQLPDMVGPNGREAYIAITYHGDPAPIEMYINARGANCNVPKVSNPAAECAANPRMYLLSDDMPDLLGSLGNGAIDDTALTEALGKQAEWFRSYCGKYSLPAKSREHLQAIGQHVFETRKSVKKQIAELEQQLKDTPAVEQPRTPAGQPITAEMTPQVFAGIEKARKQRDALLVEKGHSGNARTVEQITAELSDAQQALQDIDSRLRDLQAQEKEARTADDKLQKSLTELDYRKRTIQGKRVIYEADRQRAEDELVEANMDQCPRCSQRISKKLQEQLKAPAEAAKRNALQALADIGVELKAIDEFLPDLEIQAQQARETYAAIRDDRCSLTAQYDAATATVRRLENEKPVESRPVDAIDADVQAVDAKIARGQEILAALETIERRTDLQTQIKSLEAQREHLEWAVEAFEKGAVINTLGGDGQKLFLERVNELLTPFGHHMEINTCGKDMTLRMQTERGMVSVSQVSTGQFVICQLAVGCAFGEGGIVLVDQVDALDYRNKGILVKLAPQCNAGSLWFAAADSLPNMDIEAIERALGGARVVRV